MVGDCCVSLKMLKSPHKEIYSFKLTMLWLSLSSSLPLGKYFHQNAHHDCGLGASILHNHFGNSGGPAYALDA